METCDTFPATNAFISAKAPSDFKPTYSQVSWNVFHLTADRWRARQLPNSLVLLLPTANQLIATAA